MLLKRSWSWSYTFGPRLGLNILVLLPSLMHTCAKDLDPHPGILDPHRDADRHQNLIDCSNEPRPLSPKDFIKFVHNFPRYFAQTDRQTHRHTDLYEEITSLAEVNTDQFSHSLIETF